MQRIGGVRAPAIAGAARAAGERPVPGSDTHAAGLVPIRSEAFDEFPVHQPGFAVPDIERVLALADQAGGRSSYLDRTTLTPEPDGRVRQVIEISVDGRATWEVRLTPCILPAEAAG